MKLWHHPEFYFVLGLLIFDGLFFGLTNPMKVAASLLVIGFGLVFLTVYCACRGFLLVVRLYGVPFGRHGRRAALMASGMIAGLLALQSIGELTSRDVLLLPSLAIILYLYLSYGRLKLEAR